mmetsp:Transcript_27704/g.62097  ORF Transcript_27704/g.62097 Transcript_27704/m.62097 type:complete len:117 (-) Transcript_27704:158-508(-)
MTAKRLFCAIASLLLLIAAAETIRGVTFEANSDSVGSPLTTLDEEQVDPGPAADPQLTDCLLSAVKEEDCGSLVKGCYWCAEPVYGLCLTKDAAIKVKWMPFFTCHLDDDGNRSIE